MRPEGRTEILDSGCCVSNPGAVRACARCEDSIDAGPTRVAINNRSSRSPVAVHSPRHAAGVESECAALAQQLGEASAAGLHTRLHPRDRHTHLLRGIGLERA